MTGNKCPVCGSKLPCPYGHERTAVDIMRDALRESTRELVQKLHDNAIEDQKELKRMRRDGKV